MSSSSSSSPSSSFISSINEALYTSQFCEENVYHLAIKFMNWKNDFIKDYNENNDIYNGYVVFISNENETIPLWKQRASTDDETPVIWDYHVIFIVENEKKKSSNDIKHSIFSHISSINTDTINKSSTFHRYVYDLDSVLAFPIESSIYCNEAIKSHLKFPSNSFKQKFRVIPANDYIKYFSSDRSHMKLSKVPYPCWDIIQGINSLSTMNLSEYTSMSVSNTNMGSNKDIEELPLNNYIGHIMSCDQFTSWCCGNT
jgi:hypothetical protein